MAKSIKAYKGRDPGTLALQKILDPSDHTIASALKRHYGFDFRKLPGSSIRKGLRIVLTHQKLHLPTNPSSLNNADPNDPEAVLNLMKLPNYLPEIEERIAINIRRPGSPTLVLINYCGLTSFRVHDSYARILIHEILPSMGADDIGFSRSARLFHEAIDPLKTLLKKLNRVKMLMEKPSS